MIYRLSSVFFALLFFLNFAATDLFCSRTIEKSFPVGPGGSLIIDAQSSSIIVDGTSRSNVLPSRWS